MELFEKTALFSNRNNTTLQLRIYKGEAFLKKAESENCLVLLNTLQKILPEALYQNLYLPIIEHFVDYVQTLPARKKGLFSEQGSLLDYSLTRATYTLTFALKQFYPHQKDFKHLKDSSDIAPLKLCAAFTAALFMNIGQLLNDYEIYLYDADGKMISIWEPFQGSMAAQNATFYSFKYNTRTSSYPLRQMILINMILSTGSKTTQFFKKITQARHVDLFEQWLSFLLSHHESGGGFDAMLTLIPFAEKQTIDDRIQQLTKITHHPTSVFYDEKKLRGAKFNRAYILGEQFLEWLREQVDSNQDIHSLDEQRIRRTKEGILIARAKLIEFSHLYKLNPEVVEQQFNAIVALYPPSVNERARQSSALGGTSQVGLGQWLTVHNPALIFSIGKIPPFFLMNTVSPYNINVNKPAVE